MNEVSRYLFFSLDKHSILFVTPKILNLQFFHIFLDFKIYAMINDKPVKYFKQIKIVFYIDEYIKIIQFSYKPPSSNNHHTSTVPLFRLFLQLNKIASSLVLKIRLDALKK